MGVVEELVRAREAYDRREWVAAYDGLSDTSTDDLTASDFARLATAAYLLGRRNDCVQALQRAYAASIASDDVPAAVRCCFWLAMVLLDGGEAAVAGGWVARAQRLLDDLDEDVVERGYVLVLTMMRHVAADEHDAAVSVAEQVESYGRRLSDPDLLAHGQCVRGRMLMYTGRVPEGLALLDEAMVAVSAGEVSPIFAGQIYCAMIEGCQEVSDFGRAAEWTTNLTRWCDSQSGLVPFTGQCAVHRGQIMRVRGAFTEALDEFERALRRYVAAGASPAAGLAWAERGDVLRIRGELPTAEAAYAQAVGFGHDPQPGLSLLWVAQGRTASALAAVRRLLAEPRDPVHRSQLLPAATEVLLAGGAIDEAAPLAAELASVAEQFGCSALRAAAGFAVGSVALARGEQAAAVAPLRQSERIWTQLRAPYETARTRVRLGVAFREMGDEDSSLAELDAARRTFAELGAAPAEREVAALIGPAAPRGLTARELEVLRLVATGRGNTEIAAELVLSEKTVARHLSNIFTKLDVGSRTAAAAFAFEQHLL
ncbi:MAG: LuxR C-terminal-related transcriptional regulator [Nocardioides sp.]